MSQDKPENIAVLDKASRRRFIRAGSGLIMASATAAVSTNVLASDCDQGAEAKYDQDASENADPKGCKSKNVITHHQPERTNPVIVKTIKA